MPSSCTSINTKLWWSSSFLIMCLVFTGCINQKQTAYFQNLSIQSDSVSRLPRLFVSMAQPGDVLSITVSSLNPLASNFFNPYATAQPTQQNVINQQTTPLPPTSGYMVTADSTITLPLIGKIKVASLTNEQIAGVIQEKLKIYLKEPTVSVRNLNFHVTVLGEVNRPSMFNITNERLTLPEALGLAGDLTIFGRRENVLVVREENGRRTHARLDLTKQEVFQSTYFYLHPNDVIYVEPNKSRIAGSDRIFQIVPIVLSALSFLAIIITRR